ncbi:TetR/AcrR family transcriptional regulator [Microbacterium sp. cx-59]|uniref:TetR/AcrR family transcriptional regulator n=1 Tax=Microbacterium sp. cx-59 TaxID=2891207 RepID=UPI001E4B65B7|nr:TetR/AcrR family transcriptional regulator [Microbacterium sp. cx-59]MCC4908338.1 TetR/AcrR family transcriptional regulator [Microbacterium sp. cx-59]
MPRPSVADERTRQIIDATIATIGAHGITGASLDRIAEQAGMSRGHVRHFVGNRDDLLRESARRFYFEGTDGTSILPSGTDTIGAAMAYLFGPEFTEPGSDNAVVFGFVEAARTNPAIAELLTAAYAGTETLIADLLAAEYPAASRSACTSTAYGVVAIALHNVFLSDIETSTAGTDAARDAAERLIGTLAG